MILEPTMVTRRKCHFSSPGVLASLNMVRIAVGDLVNAEVVFERVIAADVVVLLVLGPPDHAAAAVGLTGHGPELHGQVDVLVARAFHQRDVERGIFALGFLVQNAVLSLLGDLPIADDVREPTGDRAGRVGFKVPRSLAAIVAGAGPNGWRR